MNYYYLSKVGSVPMDPIEEANYKYSLDKSKDKIFLGGGEYYNENDNANIFDAVVKAESSVNKSKETKDYLFPTVDDEFNQLAMKICFADTDLSKINKYILSIQTLG